MYVIGAPWRPIKPSELQSEFSRLLRFFNSAKMNQSNTGMSDIDQSPSGIFAE